MCKTRIEGNESQLSAYLRYVKPSERNVNNNGRQREWVPIVFFGDISEENCSSLLLPFSYETLLENVFHKYLSQKEVEALNNLLDDYPQDSSNSFTVCSALRKLSLAMKHLSPGGNLFEFWFSKVVNDLCNRMESNFLEVATVTMDNNIGARTSDAIIEHIMMKFPKRTWAESGISKSDSRFDTEEIPSEDDKNHNQKVRKTALDFISDLYGRQYPVFTHNWGNLRHDGKVPELQKRFREASSYTGLRRIAAWFYLLQVFNPANICKYGEENVSIIAGGFSYRDQERTIVEDMLVCAEDTIATIVHSPVYAMQSADSITKNVSVEFGQYTAVIPNDPSKLLWIENVRFVRTISGKGDLLLPRNALKNSTHAVLRELMNDRYSNVPVHGGINHYVGDSNTTNTTTIPNLRGYWDKSDCDGEMTESDDFETNRVKPLYPGVFEVNIFFGYASQPRIYSGERPDIETHMEKSMRKVINYACPLTTVKYWSHRGGIEFTKSLHLHGDQFRGISDFENSRFPVSQTTLPDQLELHERMPSSSYSRTASSAFAPEFANQTEGSSKRRKIMV